jgi:hypothetical protein
MQLIRNALDPHHIQRPHLIEMLWLSVADFELRSLGSIEVTISRSLSNYNILFNLVKSFFSRYSVTN